MNVIFWNIRGICNNDYKVASLDMCHSNKPSLVFIAEPMVVHNSISSWF